MADTYDFSQLRGLLNQFAPSDEDKAAAQKAMLFQLGASLLGARKGREWDQLGSALQSAASAKQGALRDASQQRLNGMQQAGVGLGLLRESRQLQDAELMREQQREFAKRFSGNSLAGLPQVQGDTPILPPPHPSQAVYGNGSSGLNVPGVHGQSTGTQSVVVPASSTSVRAAPDTQGQSTPALPGGVPSKREIAQQYQARGEYWQSLGRSEKAQQYFELAQKALPQLKDQKNLTMGGRRVVVNVYADGSHEVLPDLGPDQEKAHFLDTGSSIGAVDPFTGQPVPGGGRYNKTMTPDGIASNEVARGNLAVSQSQLALARQREGREARNTEGAGWTNDLERGIQVNTRTGESRPIIAGGAPIGAKVDAKRIQQAGDALAILDMAEPLIKQATGSYIGNALDTTAQAFGGSPKGAIAAAQLEALQGALMMNQPRMEGPQSDRDTDLYRKMAGEIGNANIPPARKLAAVKIIRQLHARYASQQAPNAPARPPTVGDLEAEMRRRGMAP